MDTIELGEVTVTRVVEWQGPVAPMPVLFPDLERFPWRTAGDEAAGRSWDATSDDYLAAAQTWVLRSEGAVVLVDNGLGNHKERSYMPAWSHREDDFLDRLAAAGVTPDDVDVVVNTHVHADHVGWNTRLVDRTWVPTFPRATYLVHQADVDYWNPRNDVPKRGSAGGINARLANGSMFEDSLDPVVAAGALRPWSGAQYRIDRNLRLEPAPGHTPGSAVLHLESGTDRAVFVGDLVHTPLQLGHPECDTTLSEDQAEAVRSRQRVLGEAADRNVLVLPAHLTGAGAMEIERRGSAFGVRRRAPFSESVPTP